MTKNDVLHLVDNCDYVFSERIVFCTLTTVGGFIIHGLTSRDRNSNEFSDEHYQEQAYNNALEQLIDCELAKKAEEKYKGNKRGLAIKKTEYFNPTGSSYTCILTLNNGFKVLGVCPNKDKNNSDSAWIIANDKATQNLRTITKYVEYAVYGKEVNNG